MYTTLPNPYHTSTNPSQNQSHFYTPSKPSPLSSSPLRNPPSSSPLKERDANTLTTALPSSLFPSSPPRWNPNRDVQMSSPDRPYGANFVPHHQAMDENARMKHGQNTMITPPAQSTRHEVYSKRPSKPNPLLASRPSSNEGRETRRKLFLKMVRETADEKRWKDRGVGGDKGEEELLRCIWMQEERKREEGRRREARLLLGGEPEIEEEAVGSSADEMMAEEVARDEEREVEEYLERIPIPSTSSNGASDFEAMMFGRVPANESTETLYGSDDEYDEIFMDVIEEEQRNSESSTTMHQQQLQRQPTPAYMEDEEMMDMS